MSGNATLPDDPGVSTAHACAIISSDLTNAPRTENVQKRVLVTDDHPSIRFLLRCFVETEQFTVCGEAANGAEAIEKVKALVPDLILLAFSMPGMNGGETARILKKSIPQIPIILFTLHEESANEALAAAMGVDLVLAKPGAAIKLLECMRSVLGLGAGPSPTVGPLAVPMDTAPGLSQPAQPSHTEDEPTEPE